MTTGELTAGSAEAAPEYRTVSRKSSGKAGTPDTAPSPHLRRKFRLLQYFMVTSLIAFALVATVLVHFEQLEVAFYKDIQTRQSGFVQQLQDRFAAQQDAVARRDLLSIHEAGNVNLTRLFANALWESDFAPFVRKAATISADACRAIPDVTDATGRAAAPAAKKACFSDIGKAIMSLPGFKEIDAKVYNVVNNSTVFKIKVFDLRGITVYSSEHLQIGEDKSTNAGWKAAAGGAPASELTHRAKFSAFEGVVENRDLISSYLPVLSPANGEVVGVFEVYSDVSPFLAQIRKTSTGMHKIAAANLETIGRAAAEDQQTVDANSNLLIAVVLAALLLLYAALFLIVRSAQRIISDQQRQSEQAQQQLAQSDKLASLGQMVAGVAHQLNTPLAFSQSNVNLVIDRLRAVEAPVHVAALLSDIVRRTQGDRIVINTARARGQLEAIDASKEDVVMMRDMLQDVLHGIGQMSELVHHMRNFTRLDRAKVADCDINECLRTVVYIARSVIPNGITVIEEYGEIPEVSCNPSQLNQVFLNLVTNAAHAIAERGTITVRSRVADGNAVIDIVDTGSGIPEDVLPHIFETYFTTKPAGQGTGLGLPIALEVVRQHGGDIRVDTHRGTGSTFSVRLPLRNAALARAA